MQKELSREQLYTLMNVAAFPQKLSHWQEYTAGHIARRIDDRIDGYLPQNSILDLIADGKMTLKEFDSSVC